MVPAFHGPGEGSTFHDSISNPVFNHVGHFATCRDRGLQVAVPRRREPSLPGAALPLPRGRRRLGAVVARRPHRALGEAQPRRARTRQRPPPRRRRPLPRAVPSDYGGTLWRETTRDELTRRWDVHPEDPSDSFARLPVVDEGRAAAAVRRALLLRVRGRRPRHRVGVRRRAQPRWRAPARDVRLRHRALGRAAHGARCSRRSYEPLRRRSASTTTTSATSCSPTPCVSGRRRTRHSSPGTVVEDAAAAVTA